MTMVLSRREEVTLDAVYRVAWQGEGLRFSVGALQRMADCRAAFLRLLQHPDIVIYGVTSGYGQMAKHRLTAEARKAHAGRAPLAAMSSFGEPLPERVTRTIVLARLTNFVEGHAAISPPVAEAVAALLAAGPLPPVPALGNGCPGEIQALAHLFGPLAQAVPLAEKDALSLINGSPCASALVADAALVARGRIALAEQVFALAWEALAAPLDHLDPAFDLLWGDPFEATALAELRALLKGVAAEGRRPYQAPVSWRDVPRVLGQARRALAQAEEVAAISLRAVSDNPVFLPPDPAHPDPAHPHGRALSNGGYHNAKAYPAMDDLAAVWADLAQLCDRQVTKLQDGEISLLPPRLAVSDDGYVGTLGFTAAAYAEQARHAAQRTFLPGSEGGGFGQNDVASPSFPAWRKQAEGGRCLDACLAMLAVVASQAFFVTDRPAPRRLAALLDEVRGLVPPVEGLRGLGPQVESLQQRFTAQLHSAERLAPGMAGMADLEA